MRVLHAFVSQEHYTNWSSANAATTETIPTVDSFLRTFGTPLISFDSADQNEFVRVEDGSYVRINYNYYNDLAQWSTPSVTEQQTQQTQPSLAIPGALSTIGNIYMTISEQFTSLLHAVFKPTAPQV